MCVGMICLSEYTPMTYLFTLQVLATSISYIASELLLCVEFELVVNSFNSSWLSRP
jgi:hypothetical protein